MDKDQSTSMTRRTALTGLALTGTALDQVATQLKSLGYTAQGEGEVLVVRAEDAR